MFCPSYISSSLQTIYHFPALQLDAERSSKLLRLHSSHILFFWDEMQNKNACRNPFIYGITELVPGQQPCSWALESLAHTSSPWLCKWNNWLSWGKFFLQESVGLSLPDCLLLVFSVCYNKTFTYFTLLFLDWRSLSLTMCPCVGQN